MVNVTDCTNVNIGFCSFIFLLCHSSFLQIIVVFVLNLAFTAIVPHCLLAVNYVTENIIKKPQYKIEVNFLVAAHGFEPRTLRV